MSNLTAVKLTEKELVELSAVSASDTAGAIALWKHYAPTDYKSMIDSRYPYEWDVKKRQYKDTRNNRYIKPFALRGVAIEPFLLQIRILMREISSRLQSAEITLAEWQLQTTNITKHSQIAVALVANGGVQNTTSADNALIALSILSIITALSGFALDIEMGKQLLNGKLLSRIDLYANAGRDIFEQVGRDGMVLLGKTMERRVLMSGANHCRTHNGKDGCVELSELGWRPIKSLPRLYDTPCGTNCLCHFEFK